ncbi:PliI family lysozyme inhibitor of I-type lysozyme [Parashewanella tropica]|uniref:PliI family lysozyme inhibitor of I-type lysozyme n=1 Tax=Parashewanella tropica TaxID=2547970 RepID=UPI00105A39F4|nr:PliI family lysozyme inhibitor of I-type lysozyme [Parashewanella tropica]
MKYVMSLVVLFSLMGCQANSVSQNTNQPTNQAFYKIISLDSGQHIVVSVPKQEPESIGSYSVRLYGISEPAFPFDNFISGMIQERDGSIVAVDVIKQSKTQTIVQIIMQSAGSGGYLQKAHYLIKGRTLTFTGFK